MRSLMSALMLSALCLAGSQAAAQERDPGVVPHGAKFVVHVDLDAFRASKVGGTLMEAATRAATEELGNGEQGIEQIREAVGFDPLTEIHGITIFGSDFDKPEDNLQLIVRLGKTTGNLEGLVLGLPGYESETVGDYVIHSVSPDPKVKVSAAIHTAANGDKCIVAATTRANVESLLKSLDASADSTATIGAAEGVFVSVHVLELPLDKIGDGPQANVARMMKELTVQVSEVEDNFHLALRIGLEDEQKAEQIRQMAQGAAAMVALVQDEGDEDLKRVQEILKGLTVERDGSQVRLNLTVPADQVMKFLREEADLPL